ncbi:hypothetical protein M758_2G064200 [Ceratodon purpureus]|nr:hypothetical protein M758_2G064200 [Ceratodon purpureus]
MMAKSLAQENDILRFQLNDLINREKNQRMELQRLRAHREVEVSTLVNATTQKLKGEVERLKGMLEPAASSLAAAVSEKDKALNDKMQLMADIESMKKASDGEETEFGGRMRSLESAIYNSTAMASNILQSVEAFQKHVLPNFKIVNTQIDKSQKPCDNDGPDKLVDELQKLEAAVAMLRVIVDAKNDTLVLIRGKLKQENDELRAELADARERPPVIEEPQAVTEKQKTCADEVGIERNILRQEIHSLQDLYSAKFKQLQTKLKAHEQAETVHRTKYSELRQECQSLQSQLTTIEASRRQLEDSLKDETSARAQLVTDIYHMRKENESLQSELEMVKVNQKFFGGHARKGRLPMEKMDLINTVNQLLSENSKLRSDKTAIEEEMRKQRRTSVLERVRSVITSRDVDMCASNKVGDSELASKLARARLQTLGQSSPTQFALTDGSPGLSMAMVSNPFIKAADPDTSDPSTEVSSTRNSFTPVSRPKKMSDIYEAGQMGLAQLAGLRERGITVGSVLS